MSIKIFTFTHKKFEIPPDKMYQPLQVGHFGKEDLGYWCDDTGEHISNLNCYYSELTGFYWIWKNYHEDDYIGTCHYRRYLLNRFDKIFTKKEYEELLKEYDMVTTLRVQLNNSYYDGFSANHNIHALDVTGEVIQEKYPEYYPSFVRLVHSNETYFGNILVTSHALFDDYCTWLFSIFFEVQKRINLETGEDDYHKRVFGFISEFLLLVFVTTRKLKVYECKVGMLGEKAETREVKEKLADFFAKKDVVGAKQYFLQTLQHRPDVLMEASDVTGELKLSMQVLATMEQEEKKGLPILLERSCDFAELMREFTVLNHVVLKARNGIAEEDNIAFLKEKRISTEEIRVAVLMLKGSDEEKERLYAFLEQKITAKEC